MDRELLTTADCAALASMHRKTIIRLIREGTIRGTMMGGRWYVRRRDFETWLDSIGKPPPARRGRPPRNAPK